MSHDILTCRNILYKKGEHTGIINNLCDKLVQSCVIASNEARAHAKLSDKTLPLWKEIAEPYMESDYYGTGYGLIVVSLVVVM